MEVLEKVLIFVAVNIVRYMTDAIKKYEDQRIKEVLLYILSKTGVVDYYHLMKILYLQLRNLVKILNGFRLERQLLKVMLGIYLAMIQMETEFPMGTLQLDQLRLKLQLLPLQMILLEPLNRHMERLMRQEIRPKN